MSGRRTPFVEAEETGMVKAVLDRSPAQFGREFVACSG